MRFYVAPPLDNRRSGRVSCQIDRRVETPGRIASQSASRGLTIRMVSRMCQRLCKRDQLLIKSRNEAIFDPSIVICPLCGPSAVPHSCPRVEREATSLPSPGTMMQKGNTDPFSTSIIVVGATVSRLVSFNRSCLLPSIHRERSVAKNDSYATPYWKDSISSLQDEYQGFGYLSRFAAILASIPSDRKTMTTAMVFKQRASESLHQRLTRQSHMQVQCPRRNAQVTDLC